MPTNGPTPSRPRSRRRRGLDRADAEKQPAPVLRSVMTYFAFAGEDRRFVDPSDPVDDVRIPPTTASSPANMTQPRPDRRRSSCRRTAASARSKPPSARYIGHPAPRWWKDSGRSDCPTAPESRRWAGQCRGRGTRAGIRPEHADRPRHLSAARAFAAWMSPVGLLVVQGVQYVQARGPPAGMTAAPMPAMTESSVNAISGMTGIVNGRLSLPTACWPARRGTARARGRAPRR